MSTRKTVIYGFSEKSPRASYLLMHFRSRHLLQVLQVGVEQVAAGQRNPQNPLDDVANGAVVRETDLFCCVHEVTATGKIEGQRGSELMHELSASLIFSLRATKTRQRGGVHLTWPTGSSSRPDPDSHRTLLLQ